MRVNLVPESARHLQMTRTRQMRVICVRVRVKYLRPTHSAMDQSRPMYCSGGLTGPVGDPTERVGGPSRPVATLLD